MHVSSFEYEKPGEKCAVAAVAGEGAAELVAEELFALQHRGPEASGIASQRADGSIESHRRPGLVRDVYHAEDIARLTGNLAIGQNKYSTNGSKDRHLQPVLDEPTGFALGHNGNLPVTKQLETFLGKHNINTAQLNDSEMMGLAIAQYIRNGHDIADSVELAYPMFRGAFSSVALHDGLVVAFRDPKGIRPLALGSFDGGHTFASETCGLDIVDAEYLREVQPGEMVVLSESGIEETRQLADGEEKLDIFEFVYFARHDSLLYGQRVNEVRRRFGEQLAEQHPPTVDDVANILVVPVPDTSLPAAEGYADRLGLKHRQAIIKNRYIGRTFLQPTQQQRHTQLRRKHTLIPEAVKDRDIILIDDSIVRLNTIPRLVEQARQAGARSVSVLIASPPVRFPDFYGIDTPKQSELAAANMTVEAMRREIKAKYLGYLSLGRMVAATELPAEKFNLSSFTGEYPIGIGHRKDEIGAPVSMEFADS